jgi:Zn-dependent protease with chaperone function
MKIRRLHLERFCLRAALLILAALSLHAPLGLSGLAFAQQTQADRSGSHSSGSRGNTSAANLEIVERAMRAVCSERRIDPLGSVPIDEMQSRPSLPLKHPEAVAGAQRAMRLLPVARELAAAALRQLGTEHNIDAKRIASATRRIHAVVEIEPDMELRDNASVTLSNPRTITFGTIFLAGLPSDEGMVSVLAHELAHMADGKEDSLHNLFRIIGRRAAGLTGLRISGRRPEELTADLIGAMAARSFIARTPNSEPLKRRLARLVEHNCVDEDETDDDHLSPRDTMRALLALDPALARDVLGVEQIQSLPDATSYQTRPRRTSLTREREASYHHHRFR